MNDQGGTINVETFIWLLFAHYIGDFALQSDWIAQNKRNYWYVLFAHSMIWAAIISMALEYLGLFSLWKVLFLIIGHFIIDKWKTTKQSGEWKWIYPDQILHIIQLIVVYIF